MTDNNKNKNGSKAIEKIETGIIDLTRETARKYLCQNATGSELDQFVHLAKTWDLDPWKRQIHLVKYGDNPAQIVVGYEAYIRRASESGKLEGWKPYTVGDVSKPKEFKACVEIHIKGWKFPFVHEVFYEEYVQRRRDGSITKFWKDKPKTMLKKVAISQGFRFAFPEDVGGMPYTAEEIMESPEFIEHTPVREGAELAGKIVEQGDIKKVEQPDEKPKAPPKRRRRRKAEESDPEDVGPAKGDKPKPHPEPKGEPVIDVEPLDDDEETPTPPEKEEQSRISELFLELKEHYGRDTKEILPKVHARLAKKFKLPGNVDLDKDLTAEQEEYVIGCLEITIETEKAKLLAEAEEISNEPDEEQLSLPEEDG